MRMLGIALKLFLSLLSFNLYSTQLTTNVARKMKFYDKVYELRLKTDEYLRQMQYKLNNQIQNLRDQKRYRMADKMLLEFTKTLNFYSDEIDVIFDDISQIVVLGGYKLDVEEASVTEKIRFIEYARDRLSKSIDNIMKRDLGDIENIVYTH